jgi:nucleotidyltransferase substrate binding protein (TIGR01987 family)
MLNEKNGFVLEDFKLAVKKLEEVLVIEKTEIVRDSTIVRFEFCFDLAWKSIKNYAKEQGVECYSPKECLKSAYQLKLIDNQDKWLEMVNDRNLIAHLYKEAQADKLYSSAPVYLELFKKLIESISKNQ